jgi:hypothetical protein
MSKRIAIKLKITVFAEFEEAAGPGMALSVGDHALFSPVQSGADRAVKKSVASAVRSGV